MPSIRKVDIIDADIVDANELASTGSIVFITGASVVSTNSGTKIVTLSGIDVFSQPSDTHVEAGDKVTLSGTTGGADGTYTIASVTDATHVVVVEAIATSTGGSANFKYKSGAKAVGVDTGAFTHSSASNLQTVLSDLDGAITGGGGGGGSTEANLLLAADPVKPSTDYAVTRSSGVVTKEEWFRQSDASLLKSVDYTRTSGVVDGCVIKVFASDGMTVTDQITVAFTRSGGQVVSATRVRDLTSTSTASFDLDLLLAAEPPAPTSDYTITRSSGVVTQESWARNSDASLLKTIDYTRSSGVVTEEVRKVFDTDGTTILAQLTVDYTRSSGVIVSATYTRDI